MTHSQNNNEVKHQPSPRNAQSSNAFNVKTWCLGHKECIMKCGAVLVCILAIAAILVIIQNATNEKDVLLPQQGKSIDKLSGNIQQVKLENIY